ncbi:hypothetical protein RJ639_000699 [Escallonia herrerae]|uniref:RRM domain-containing protein n=1 Tax=Escallonia herrerae TaxID=1293975 RepID=A0AA89BGL1_9ASTE|nr:hypothetical protein RJ639_000699 [Escallonia herrerae]
MAKKSKEQNRSPASNNGDSNNPNIFKTLFGDIQEQGSIFTDNNPFRRKPSEGPSQTHDSAEDPSDPGEVKKRKRNKDKLPNSHLHSNGEEASETPSGTKKSKKGKPAKPNLDSDPSDGAQRNTNGRNEKNGNLGEPLNPSFDMVSNERKVKNSNLGLELKDNRSPGLALEIKEEGRRKKKRKRDELEVEYEAKRYGVVVNEENGEGGMGGKGVGEKRKKLDSAEDMLVSKEGFDDEDKLSRTVFVGNLPLKVKKKALLKEFTQFGEVESVRIRSVPILNSKTPRKGAIMKKQINEAVDSVHAYIVFKTEESAQASLSHNMAVVGGNHIRVDRACPPRKKLKGEDALLYDNKRTVFIGNLPFDVKDEEIYQLFSGIKTPDSGIEAVRVVRDPGTSVGKGIAYVLFKTRVRLRECYVYYRKEFAIDELEKLHQPLSAAVADETQLALERHTLTQNPPTPETLEKQADDDDAANSVVKRHSLKIRDRELRLSHSNSTPSKRKSAENNVPPGKRLAVESRTPASNKVKEKTAITYQGMRASKSGVQKKFHAKRTEQVKLNQTQTGQKVKVRSDKRPAVAARKSKALKGNVGGGGGKKRKLESQTPESARRDRKSRKFRRRVKSSICMEMSSETAPSSIRWAIGLTMARPRGL